MGLKGGVTGVKSQLQEKFPGIPILNLGRKRCTAVRKGLIQFVFEIINPKFMESETGPKVKFGERKGAGMLLKRNLVGEDPFKKTLDPEQILRDNRRITTIIERHHGK